MLYTRIVVAVAVLAALTSSPAAAAPTMDWEECAADRTADCGTLKLPIDRSRPGGDSFELAVIRRPATDPSRRIGVLLVNPGGPGDSGVNFVRDKGRTYFSADVQARFDIIGFDPRGIGQSEPVRCSAEVLARQPSPYPRNQAGFDRLVEYNRELRADCRDHSGPIFDHADTLNVVHDMDALRRALGERRISYFGHSYGTLIGQQYAERYGSRVRGMVLTANIDHSIGVREFLESTAATGEDSFRGFVAWCERTESCALHGEDVTAVWDAVLARADRGEVTDPDNPGRPLTAADITRRAVTEFKGPDWDELAEWVAKLAAPATAAPATATPATAAPATATPGGLAGPAGLAAPAGQSEPDTRPFPFLAVFCQDWAFRVKDHAELARLTAAELRQAPHLRGSIAHGPIAGCVGWPDRVNNPQHRLRVTGSPRILLMNARHDPVNPMSWVTNVHRQARGAADLIVYEGWGHQVYNRDGCTRTAVDRHLIGEPPRPASGTTAPRRGTCAGRN